MEVDLGVLHALYLKLRQELLIVLIGPRVAEGKPVLLDILLELKAEGDFDAVLCLSLDKVMNGSCTLTQTNGSGVLYHSFEYPVLYTGLIPSLHNLC